MGNRISEWFKEAVPTPSTRNRDVQVGCHMEEFLEMLDALDCTAGGFSVLKFLVNEIATDLKTGKATVTVNNPQELLDALADQVVTATGIAHMQGFKFDEALIEVDKSNWSKFVDGKARFDANGKIAKGAGYYKPDLRKFL